MLTAEYAYSLVVWVSVASFLASLATISLFRRARATTGHSRISWIVTAGLATGAGAWATHLIAVLAYGLGLPISYSAARIALTFAVAMGAAMIGLRIAVNGNASWRAPAG